jgi:hypothetical protein
MLIKGCFRVNEREEAKGCNVNLNKAKFAFLLEEFPTMASGVPEKS